MSDHCVIYKGFQHDWMIVCKPENIPIPIKLSDATLEQLMTIDVYEECETSQDFWKYECQPMTRWR